MLTTYLFCPRKLFLEQVLALKEPPKESTVLGSLRHEIYDSINKSEEKIVTSIAKKMSYNQTLDIYKTIYSKIFFQKILYRSCFLSQTL